MNIINFIFGFNGRTSRTYFALLLPLFIALQLLMVVLSVMISQSFQNSNLTELFVILLIFPIYFWLKYAYVTKRVHDFNKKISDSKLAYVMLMVDIALAIAVILFQNFGLALPCLIISLICLISLAFKKGDEGENNFGKPQVPFWKKTNS